MNNTGLKPIKCLDLLYISTILSVPFYSFQQPALLSSFKGYLSIANLCLSTHLFSQALSNMGNMI